MEFEKKIEEALEGLPDDVRVPIKRAFDVFRDEVIFKVYEEVKEIRKDVSEIKKILAEVVEAQKTTEVRVNSIAEKVEKIAEAQAKTEEEMRKVWELRRKNEEEMKRVWKVHEESREEMKKVWELQKRNEEEMKKVWEAQKRNEEEIKNLSDKVAELVEEQKRTSEQIRTLMQEHKKTRTQLGGLADSFGYLLEDRTIKSLPRILKEKFGVEVIGSLKRTYMMEDLEYVEVNIYGKGKRNGREIYIVGETKTRLSKKAIDKFLEKCKKIMRDKETIKIIVSYVFTPKIEDYAKEKGILLIPSYELDL